jgi:hypothetical protein
MSEEYEKVYDTFWKTIVEDDDGNLNVDQVKRELFDWYFSMQEVAKVYSEITGGRLSKPNYYASGVISAYEEHVEELKAWAIEDWISDNLYEEETA